MCNVCHQLRSKCEANDFEEITEVCPWICLDRRPASARATPPRAGQGLRPGPRRGPGVQPAHLQEPHEPVEREPRLPGRLRRPRPRQGRALVLRVPQGQGRAVRQGRGERPRLRGPPHVHGRPRRELVEAGQRLAVPRGDVVRAAQGRRARRALRGRGPGHAQVDREDRGLHGRGLRRRARRQRRQAHRQAVHARPRDAVRRPLDHGAAGQGRQGLRGPEKGPRSRRPPTRSPTASTRRCRPTGTSTSSPSRATRPTPTCSPTSPRRRRPNSSTGRA